MTRTIYLRPDFIPVKTHVTKFSSKTWNCFLAQRIQTSQRAGFSTNNYYIDLYYRHLSKCCVEFCVVRCVFLIPASVPVSMLVVCVHLLLLSMRNIFYRAMCRCLFKIFYWIPPICYLSSHISIYSGLLSKYLLVFFPSSHCRRPMCQWPNLSKRSSTSQDSTNI